MKNRKKAEKEPVDFIGKRVAIPGARVKVSSLDGEVGQPIEFSIGENEAGWLYTGFCWRFGAEHAVPFVLGVAAYCYPESGLFTPKVVYSDGQERILASIRIREQKKLA